MLSKRKKKEEKIPHNSQPSTYIDFKIFNGSDPLKKKNRIFLSLQDNVKQNNPKLPLHPHIFLLGPTTPLFQPAFCFCLRNEEEKKIPTPPPSLSLYLCAKSLSHARNWATWFIGRRRLRRLTATSNQKKKKKTISQSQNQGFSFSNFQFREFFFFFFFSGISEHDAKR